MPSINFSSIFPSTTRPTNPTVAQSLYLYKPANAATKQATWAALVLAGNVTPCTGLATNADFVKISSAGDASTDYISWDGNIQASAQDPQINFSTGVGISTPLEEYHFVYGTSDCVTNTCKDWEHFVIGYTGTPAVAGTHGGVNVCSTPNLANHTFTVAPLTATGLTLSNLNITAFTNIPPTPATPERIYKIATYLEVLDNTMPSSPVSIGHILLNSSTTAYTLTPGAVPLVVPPSGDSLTYNATINNSLQFNTSTKTILKTAANEDYPRSGGWAAANSITITTTIPVATPLVWRLRILLLNTSIPASSAAACTVVHTTDLNSVTSVPSAGVSWGTILIC